MTDPFSTGTPYARRSMVDRMIGAARLDVNTYEEVEADRTATGQAAAVVAIAAVATAIGAWGNTGEIIGGVLSALLGWGISAALAYFVGTRLFHGTADWGELLRTLGFAQAPRVLSVLAFIPGLGWLVTAVVSIWVLVAEVIAIRQALDVTTGQAIVTALVSLLIVLAVTVIPMILLGGAMAIGGAMG